MRFSPLPDVLPLLLCINPDPIMILGTKTIYHMYFHAHMQSLPLHSHGVAYNDWEMGMCMFSCEPLLFPVAWKT